MRCARIIIGYLAVVALQHPEEAQDIGLVRGDFVVGAIGADDDVLGHLKVLVMIANQQGGLSLPCRRVGRNRARFFPFPPAASARRGRIDIWSVAVPLHGLVFRPLDTSLNGSHNLLIGLSIRPRQSFLLLPEVFRALRVHL